MEDDLKIPHDSAKTCNISLIEDEKEKVKDFVYKHFREVADGSLFINSEESSIKEHGSGTRKDKPTLNKAHCKLQQRAIFSGKILSFGCSVCKDDSTYSPNDLLKHFRASHKGTLPTYPCDLCGFVTNEFPALQRHRIEHRNTLVTCELCNDGVQYSLLLLTRHYIMCHSLNGQFHCDWCEFTTMDAGTFVQHIHHHNESPWKCSKCRHVSLNEEDHQRHMKAHAGAFTFTCQTCGYGAMRSEHLKKHMTAVHKDKSEKRNSRKSSSDDGVASANAAAGVKLLLKKNCELPEAQKMAKPNWLPNQNGKPMQPEIVLEETHHFGEGPGAKKDNKYPGPGSHNTESSVPVMLQECENSVGPEAHTSPNGLTVLMVKNKISLPPNCTTKVMGFRVVDGKKHLVLKVIPTAKQDVVIQNHSLFEDLDPSAQISILNKSKDLLENGDLSDGKSSTSHSGALSPDGGCRPVEDDIMAVKVKIEEEETSVCSLDSTLHRDDDDDDDAGDPSDCSGNRSSTADSMHPETSESSDQIHLNQTAFLKTKQFDTNPLTPCCDALGCGGSQTAGAFAGDVADLPSNGAQETPLSKPRDRNVAESSRSAQEPSATDEETETPVERNCGNLTLNSASNSSLRTSEYLAWIRSDLKHKTSQPNYEKCKESRAGSESCTPNQEVFAFHNYSKETFAASPNTNQTVDGSLELPADKDRVCRSSQCRSALAESPQQFLDRDHENDSAREKSKEAGEQLAESDSDESSSANYQSAEEENPESVLQDFNIIKIEEENIPISRKQFEVKSGSTSVGSFVEEHSEEIITQQLNRERFVPGGASGDSSKPTKTTLRILQLPEGKQPVLLRTAENRFALPMHVKTTPGFKLITNSVNPQINVSYIKSGLELSGKPSGEAPAANSTRLGLGAAAGEKGTTLLSALQSGGGATSNHYLINSQGLKGPVFLSSAAHNATDKAAKSQPTCYLVQRSVPSSQTPSAPGLRLPLHSRPVLAMPVSSADKAGALQPGRQAFLLRYISPPKSSLLLNNQDSKVGARCSQSGESTGNKVIFKLVTSTGSLLTSGSTPTSSSQPLFLATRPPTQCFLVSSNKANATASNSVKKMITVHNAAQKLVKESSGYPPPLTAKLKPSETDKPVLAPRPIRPPSQRKRRRKQLFDELPMTVHKARRLSNKVLNEKDAAVLWKPVAKDVERTLRLAPFSSLQQVKCPRRHQPVVVLNHPDADIPEVANIMKVVLRYKGAVTKVSLSQKTIQALSELGAGEKKSSTKGADPRPRPVQSSVRERFLLKMKLRKKSRKKYEVVGTLSGRGPEPAAFDCWFCGRLFDNQEVWIGHGQRHLMEATRDWNKLF